MPIHPYSEMLSFDFQPDVVCSMPIRLAQARLIPQDARDHQLDPIGRANTLRATGYAPDGGLRPSHQGKHAEYSNRVREQSDMRRIMPQSDNLC